MPFTVQELSDAGISSLDYFIKNKPTDSINIDHPWMERVQRGVKTMPGGKQNAVIQLRFKNQNNFQFFNGRKIVTYNVRNTLKQATYPWRSIHDGFSLDEDRLIQNGITVTDNKVERHSKQEEIVLTDLLEEQTSVLRLGFDEKFDIVLIRDGAASTDDLAGIDFLVSTTPTTGTVGGLDRSLAANEFWRNQVSLGMTTTTTTGNILANIRTNWRNVVRNGGKPNYLMVGSDMIDGYINFLLNTFGTINHSGGGIIKTEGGDDTPTYKGMLMNWIPAFSDVDTLDSPTELWEERFYMLNMSNIQLKPIEGQDRISRKPPRPYDRYEHYWGMTWRGAFCMSKAINQAVMSVA